MIAVSARFLAALRETHSIAIRATIFRPSAPTIPIAVPVIGGQFRADTDARVRRQASLVVAFSLSDPATPEIVRELPFGGQATIERGIRYADGTEELVQLGRFRIDAVGWTETEGSATLTLSDRMAQVQDEPFVTPWSPNGLKPSNAVVEAVHQVFGDTIVYHVETTPATEPAIVDAAYDQDRAQAISDLASSVGAETLFDNLGDFVLRPRPSADGAPVWTLDAGERGTLEGTEESLDRSGVRNGVAVRGQAAADQAPVYTLAVDDDPASPTRWGGPFGKVALVATLTAPVSSQAQADDAAASLLNLRLGLARTLALRSVPNPALEPGDVIEVVHADGRSESQLVNALALALDVSGTLDLTTRSSFRPTALASSRIRVFTGSAAWRELQEANALEEALV